MSEPEPSQRRRYVILDRDGTVVVERHYLTDPDALELIPGALDGLRQLRDLGLGLVLVTNQSAIGRGLLDESGLERVHDRLASLLAADGIQLDGIYVCPHLPDDRCECRKPSPVLIERAASDLDFDPSAAFVIGDKACDIDLGRAIGATTILVRTGHGVESEVAVASRADFVADDLLQAAAHIAAMTTS